MKDDLVPGLLRDFGKCSLCHCLGDDNTDTCFADIDRQKSDKECQGRNDLKVEDRFPAHTPNLFNVGMPGNTYHQGAKEQWSNDGFYQVEEDLTDDVEVNRYALEVVAELSSCQHAEKYPGGECLSAKGINE